MEMVIVRVDAAVKSGVSTMPLFGFGVVDVENWENWIDPCWAGSANSQPVEDHRGVLRSVVTTKVALMTFPGATVDPDTGFSVTESIV